MRALPLLAAAALALTAGACAAPPAETSAGGAASGGGGERAAARAGQPWWKLSQYSRKAEFKPWVYGDVRPGKGLLSNGEDGYVLYRKGEADSSASTKPSKVRR